MKPELKEGSLLHTTHSPTAATVGNRLYGDSGVMLYRVVVQTGGGIQSVDVDATTGDKAAEAALAKCMGGKVLTVQPAPQVKAE